MHGLREITGDRGKVIDMAIRKKKTQQSTSIPDEGIEQTSVPHPTSEQLEESMNGAPVNAAPMPPTDASSDSANTEDQIGNGSEEDDDMGDRAGAIAAQATSADEAAHADEAESLAQPHANGVVNGHVAKADLVEANGSEDASDDAADVDNDGDLGKQASVQIKGRPNGVVVELGEGDWPELIALLTKRLAAAEGFFRGGQVILEAGAHCLDEGQLREVRNLLEVHDMKLGVVRSNSEETLQAAVEVGLVTSPTGGEAVADDAASSIATTPTTKSGSVPKGGNPLTGVRSRSRLTPLPKPEAAPMPPPPPRPTGHFVHRGSLRSGQILRKAESIVVIGDVNPGAQVISSGDVIVWGRLRGIAYAGVDGNRKSVVAALDFVPTQLRIANLTAIAPEQKRGRGLFFWRKEPTRRPEIARVVDERIVVEPWDEAKIGKFSNW